MHVLMPVPWAVPLIKLSKHVRDCRIGAYRALLLQSPAPFSFQPQQSFDICSCYFKFSRLLFKGKELWTHTPPPFFKKLKLRLSFMGHTSYLCWQGAYVRAPFTPSELSFQFTLLLISPASHPSSSARLGTGDLCKRKGREIISLTME